MLANCVPPDVLINSLGRGPSYKSGTAASLVLNGIGILSDADVLANYHSALRAAYGTGSVPSAPLPPAKLPALNAHAQKMLDTLQQTAEAGYDRAKQFVTDTLKAFAGLTPTNVSRVMRFATNVTSQLLDRTAEAKLWAVTSAPLAGRDFRDHFFNAALDAIPGKMEGFLRPLAQHIESTIMSKAGRYAKRTGRTAYEVAEAAGHYVNALRALEMNKVLFNNWETELNELSKIPVDQLSDTQKFRAHELTQNTTNYQQYGQLAKKPGSVRLSAVGGLSDGMARTLKSHLEKTFGMTAAEFEDMSRDFVSLAHQINTSRAERGLILPEAAAKYHNESWYVPLFSRRENHTGSINDMGLSSEERTYRMEGMTEIADSAFHTLINKAHRAAKDAAYSELGQVMYAMAMNARQQGKDIGLRLANVRDLNVAASSVNPYVRMLSKSISDSFANSGIEVNIPTPVDTPQGMRRMMTRFKVGFDKDYVDEARGFTGRGLMDAIDNTIRTYEDGGWIRKLTSLTGQANTRANPFFSPVNMFRDGHERATHLAAFDHFTESGEKLSGMRLVSQYLGNGPRAFRTVASAIQGNLDQNTRMGQYWKEYNDLGLRQNFMQGLINPGTSDVKLLEQMRKGQDPDTFWKNHPKVAKYKDMASWLKDKTIGWLDNTWNETFNNAAGFNQYLTLREAGVSMRDSATSTRESMNLYKTGKVTPLLQYLWPFVRPTMQTAANMTRQFMSAKADGTMSLNKKGLATLGTLVPLAFGLREIQDALFGEDPDTGRRKIDSMPLSQLVNSIPIPGPDGTTIKLPSGFGITQLALSLAHTYSRVQAGLMSPERFAFENMFTALKNVAPANWPEFAPNEHPFAYAAQVFTPAFLRPVIESSLNLDHFGNRVSYADPNGVAPMSEQGRIRTPAVYHEIAKMLFRTTGMDEDPATYQTAIAGSLPGPLRIITQMMEWAGGPALPKGSGKQHSTLFDAVNKLGASVMMTDEGNATRSMFLAISNKLIRDAKSMGVSLTGDPGDRGEARLATIEAKLKKAGMDRHAIADTMRMLRAQSEISKLERGFKKDIRPLWNSASSTEDILPRYEQHATALHKIYADTVKAIQTVGRR